MMESKKEGADVLDFAGLQFDDPEEILFDVDFTLKIVDVDHTQLAGVQFD